VLREVPINLLLQATDLPMVNAALLKIFEQIRAMRNQEQNYPRARQMQLLEALCRDFTNQVLKVVGAQPVMEMDDPDFMREVSKNVNLVFETWKNEIKKIDPERSGVKHRAQQHVDIEKNPIFRRLTVIN